MRQIALIAIMLIGSPTLVYADSCRYEKDIEFTVDAAGAQNLLVEVGAPPAKNVSAETFLALS